MRLIVLMNVFNEARYIAKAIESVHDFVDEIWLFDGAYKEYPHNSVSSTDGTLKIASQYPKVKIYKNDEAWENQLEKGVGPDGCIGACHYLWPGGACLLLQSLRVAV